MVFKEKRLSINRTQSKFCLRNLFEVYLWVTLWSELKYAHTYIHILTEIIVVIKMYWKLFLL